MYEQFYGLTELPFEVTPNPRYLLLTPRHREALNMLEYGVGMRKGIMLLLGEAGTGKTTLLRKALSLRLAANGFTGSDCVYITNPRLTQAQLLEHLATGFDLPVSAAASKPALLNALECTLAERRAAGRTTALIVDEAQALPDDLIEELRLLANIESDETKLLPLVLAGQPELAERLNQHHLRQFKQRIVLRCGLARYELQETGAYIVGRVRLAGGDATQLFTREAVVAIHQASRGIARTINVICDNVLITGLALGRRPVDASIVHDVCRQLDLPKSHAAISANNGMMSSTGSEPRRFSRKVETPPVQARPRVHLSADVEASPSNRIAEARARTARPSAVESDGVWEREREVAQALLDGTLTSDPLLNDTAPTGAAIPDMASRANSPVQFAATSSSFIAPDFPLRERASPVVPPSAATSHAAAHPDPAFMRAHPPRELNEPAIAFGRSDEGELAVAVRRIFLAGSGAARAVFFCTPPGDPMTDTAWQAAEFLASASGKRIAFVEDAAARGAFVRPASSLITQIGWYPGAPQRGGKSARLRDSTSDSDDVVGRSVADLLSRFDFVIVNATAPRADDLVPLACEVDGVVVLIDLNSTTRAAADALIATLRNSGARIFGAILTGGLPSRPTHPTQLNLRG